MSERISNTPITSQLRGRSQIGGFVKPSLSYPIAVAAPLLAPKELFRADALGADPRLVPSVPGIYGWWFREVLPGVPTDDSLTRDGLRLLYVGIAPQGPRGLESRKVRTLRDRLKNHTRGPIAESTLRRTLTSLLGGKLGLTVTRRDNGKLAMPADDESQRGIPNPQSLVPPR